MNEDLPPIPPGFTLDRGDLPPIPPGWRLVPPEPPAPTYGEQAKRAVGLAARTAAPAATGAMIGGALGALGGPAAPLTIPGGAMIGAGIGSIAYPLSDLAVSGWNAATGRADPLPSTSLERNLSRAGLPEPQTETERIGQAAGRGVIDGVSGAGAAKTGMALVNAIPRTAAPSTSVRMLDTMQQGPRAQAASGGVGGSVAQSATEMGAPPLFATMLGTGAGFLPGIRPNHLFADRTTGPDTASQQMGALRQILGQEGVPLSPAQRLANPSARLFESVMKYLPTSASSAARQEDLTQRGFTRAANRHAGLDADNALPATLDAHQRALGQRYDALEQATMLTPDNRFDQALQQARTGWTVGLDDNMRNLFGSTVDRLQQFVNARSQGATMPGQNFHAIDAELRVNADRSLSSEHPQVRQYGQALANLRDELQQLMQRSAIRQQQTTLPSPNGPQRLSGQELADAWGETNRQYAAFSRIKEAMGNATGREKLETGYIPASALAQQQRGRLGSDAYSRAQDDFTNLVRAGHAVLPDPIPNSGTAQRSKVQDMLTGGQTAWKPTAAGAGAAHYLGATGLDYGLTLGVPYGIAKQWYARPMGRDELGLLGLRSLQGANEGN